MCCTFIRNIVIILDINTINNINVNIDTELNLFTSYYINYGLMNNYLIILQLLVVVHCTYYESGLRILTMDPDPIHKKKQDLNPNLGKDCKKNESTRLN